MLTEVASDGALSLSEVVAVLSVAVDESCGGAVVPLAGRVHNFLITYSLTAWCTFEYQHSPVFLRKI